MELLGVVTHIQDYKILLFYFPIFSFDYMHLWHIGVYNHNKPSLSPNFINDFYSVFPSKVALFDDKKTLKFYEDIGQVVVLSPPKQSSIIVEVFKDLENEGYEINNDTYRDFYSIVVFEKLMRN